MFTPIKNFITYIQNAGGSGMFGATTTTTEISAPTPTLAIAKSINTICQETPTLTIAKTTKLIEIDSKMENGKENLIKQNLQTPEEHIIEVTLEEDNDNMSNLPLNTTVTTSTITTTNATTTTYNVNNAENNKNFEIFTGDDDIELQIKSSIMVKPSVLNVDKLEKHASPSPSNNGLRHTRTIMRRPSISGSGQIVNEEPMKFIPPPSLGKKVNRDKLNKKIPDTCSTVTAPISLESIVKPIKVTEEVASSVFNLSCESDSFLEVSLPEIPNSEIIVLNCLESSSPTTTATPTEDTIAFDDSLNNSENQNEIKSFDSIEEINMEMEAIHTDNDVGAGAVFWLNVEAAEVDVCDNNNLSVEDATSSRHVKGSSDKNQNNRNEHLEEGRSEGSDSGLGVEAAQIMNFKQLQASGPPVSVSENQPCPSASSKLTYDSTLVTHLSRRPLRSNLKRRLEISGQPQAATTTDAQKRPKRSIIFDSVKVYYFSRQQGFSCVPSAGGCTLGMSSQHHGFKTMTLAEHASELRRAHRMQLQEINPRSSSSDDSEESEEDFLSEGSGSDLDAETNGFLQPVTPKQRRALLKAAGVRKIDATEKVECRDIRNSREVCGCNCRDFCDPETCACSQAGIKCQVDRAMFPCGCSREACGNTVGRIEFNPARVRTHFIHTIMRLEMENRQQQPHVNNNNHNNLSSTSRLNNYTDISSSAHYYNPQTQSNYSSGYASPAYINEHSIGGGSQSPANYYENQPHEQHFMSGSSEMNHQGNTYHIDSLDAGIYTPYNAMQSTPTYGDLTGAVAITPYSHNISYNTTNYAETLPSKSTSTYSRRFMAQSNHNYTSERNPAPQQQNYNIANATSSPICTFVCATANDENVDGSTASFIDLSSPVANAKRLSQINDMLQQNRHTTATLVAVTPTSTTTKITNSFPVSTITESVGAGIDAISASPPPSPTSSTTISVEHDDTSNISVINNVEECLNQARFMNEVLNSSPSSLRSETSFSNSKEIRIDLLDFKEIEHHSLPSSIIDVTKEQNLK